MTTLPPVWPPAPTRAQVLARWAEFRPVAFDCLTKDPSARSLVMLGFAPATISAYQSPEIAISDAHVWRVELTVTWDHVTAPYRSQGVRGCVIAYAGEPFDRLDWRPRP